MPPRKRREASAERLKQLLTRTFEKYTAITRADDLHDFAMAADEDEEEKKDEETNVLLFNFMIDFIFFYKKYNHFFLF